MESIVYSKKDIEMAEQTITCPNCGTSIPVTKALTQQIENEVSKKFEAEAEIREKKASEAFEKKLGSETAQVELRVRKETEQATSAELSKLKNELVETQKSEKALQESFAQKVEVASRKVELRVRQEAEQAASAELSKLKNELTETQKREKASQDNFNQKVKAASRKIELDTIERVQSEYHIRELTLEKKLSDAKRDAAELKRRLDQSSQQTQGEVIELEIEKSLKQAFPEDEIKPIAKGKAGADILQKVYTSNAQYCGTIIWETKNTQTWGRSWLSKLRSDQRRVKAELAVLVSNILPKGTHHFAQIEGVWVAEFSLALSLASALRTQLTQIALLKLSSKGSSEKMELLFEYLSSTEFRQRIESIVEAFQSLQDDLNKERLMMEKQWAKREKQIQMVMHNVLGMYGDMQGIAGQSLPKIKRLELLTSGESK